MSIDKLIKRRYIMKILTKDWADMYARARFISSLQEIQQETKCNELKIFSKENFLTLLKQDEDMKKHLSNKALVEKLFCEKLKSKFNFFHGCAKRTFKRYNFYKTLQTKQAKMQDKKVEKSEIKIAFLRFLCLQLQK